MSLLSSPKLHSSADNVSSAYGVNVSYEREDPNWDAFLESAANGHHVQTSLWGEVKAWQGWTVARVLISEADEIVAGAQLMFRKARFVGNVGYVPKGPVVRSGSPGVSDLLIESLLETAAQHRIKLLFAQPPDDVGNLTAKLKAAGFRPSPIEITPTATVLIDLTSDLDTILSRMRKGMRNSVRQSGRRGITVREGTEHDLPTFHRLLTQTAQRRGFSPFSIEYFTEMWRILHPRGGIYLFLSELDGEAVAAQIVVAFNKTIVGKQIGWSGRHRERRPNEALDWATIQWAKNNGFSHYDLEGIEPEAAEALLRDEPLPKALADTPTAYKTRFGGQVHVMPEAYCYISNRMLRTAYNRGGYWLAKQAVVQNAVSRFRAN